MAVARKLGYCMYDNGQKERRKLLASFLLTLRQSSKFNYFKGPVIAFIIFCSHIQWWKRRKAKPVGSDKECEKSRETETIGCNSGNTCINRILQQHMAEPNRYTGTCCHIIIHRKQLTKNVRARRSYTYANWQKVRG